MKQILFFWLVQSKPPKAVLDGGWTARGQAGEREMTIQVKYEKAIVEWGAKIVCTLKVISAEEFDTTNIFEHEEDHPSREIFCFKKSKQSYVCFYASSKDEAERWTKEQIEALKRKVKHYVEMEVPENLKVVIE